jgi:hypothetical protein
MAIVLFCELLPVGFAPAAQTRDGESSLRMRVDASEASCIGDLRAINVAQGAFMGGDSEKGYARTLDQLGPEGKGFIAETLASGKKDGYRFTLRPEARPANGPVMHYTLSARPLNRLISDQRSFFTDETNVIRYTKENRAATAKDPPIK